MKILTRETDYAVRVLVALALTGEPFTSAKTLAHDLSMPYPFLRLLLQSLVKAGIVQSKEGARGGVRLAKEPNGITLEHIIDVFQGEINFSGCIFKAKKCGNFGSCVLRRRLQPIEKNLRESFASVSVQDLVNDLK